MNAFTPVRSVLATIIYPLQSTASLPNDMTEWISEFFQDRDQLRKKNEQLESESLLNNVRLQKMQNLERENMRLRELLGSSFRLNEHVKSAEILAIDIDPFSQKVVIDKGLQYGVFEGQSVLDATGVMGQVIRVSQFSSDVVLLTNPNHAIPVEINRNGLRAVVIGRGTDEPLQLDYVPHSADVRVGDLLITSGLGGRFPTGYPVGRVISIESLPGQVFSTIKVKAEAEIATSRNVLLVLETETSLEPEISINEPEQELILELNDELGETTEVGVSQ